MLKLPMLKLAAGLTLFSAATFNAQAQDAGALVDKLIKKGILTDQEGEEVRAEMTRDFAQTPAGKINLSPSITELKLYGDLRVRYQYDDRQPQVASTSNVNQRSRWRFRLRLNADVQLTDSFFGGFALETAQASDSGNQTFENGFDDYQIFIAKAFAGWRPSDWLTIILGKQKNPFYTTDLVWDPDINPQGLTETIAFHKMHFGGGSSEGGFAKDGTPLGGSDVHSDPNWELSLVAGQFIFDDNNEFNLGSTSNTDAYLFVEQLIGTYKFNKDTSITVAPGFMTFTAASLTGLTNENPFTDAGISGSTISTRTTTSTVNTVVDTVNAAGTSTTRVVTPTTVTTVVTTTTNPNGTARTATNATTVRAGAPTTTIIPGGAPANRVTTTAATVASASTATPAAAAPGSLPAVAGETRQLNILTAPGDISFKIGSLKTKVYWDFAYNLDGKGRFDETYQFRNTRDLGLGNQRYSSRDGIAWLIGLQVGETKKKGDWAAFVNYRETGIASVDPNLNDSDFALGELNTRGFKLGVAYQLAEAVVFNITGFITYNLNDDLVGGRGTNTINAGNPGIAQDNAVNTLQVDLNIKF